MQQNQQNPYPMQQNSVSQSMLPINQKQNNLYGN